MHGRFLNKKKSLILVTHWKSWIESLKRIALRQRLDYTT